MSMPELNSIKSSPWKLDVNNLNDHFIALSILSELNKMTFTYTHPTTLQLQQSSYQGLSLRGHGQDFFLKAKAKDIKKFSRPSGPTETVSITS